MSSQDSWSDLPPAGDRRNVRYDDDFDDLVVGRPRGDESATSIGMVGFIFSMVSVGLLVVVAVLWVFLDQEEGFQRNIDRKRWMLYWFLFLDVLSFFASLVAVILGARGVTPTNPLYRGWSMTAIVVGIVEIVVTILFGMFMTCFVLIFEAFR